MNLKFADSTFVTIILLWLSAGCTLADRASLPTLPSEPGWKRSFVCMTRGCNEQTVMLANGNFEILLKAHNFSFHQPGKDYFAISVLINTQVPTSMNFVDIQLQFLNNQRKSPEGFMIRKIGPEKSLPSHFCMGDSYYSRGEIRRYPFYYKVDNTRYQISPGTCYDLFFSGPPPVPGEVFYLNLQSVIHGEKTLRLPSIRFE